MGKYTKEACIFKNQSIGHKRSLQMDFTTPLSCAVSNSKLLSKISIDGQVEPQLVPKIIILCISQVTT